MFTTKLSITNLWFANIINIQLEMWTIQHNRHFLIIRTSNFLEFI
jgi:hypothetical protein